MEVVICLNYTFRSIYSLVTCGCGLVIGPYACLTTENSGIQSQMAFLGGEKDIRRMLFNVRIKYK